MNSKVINISKYEDNLSAILSEAQIASAEAGLDAKKALRIRLLAEELIGMLKELSGIFEGTFRLNRDGSKFEFVTQIYMFADMDKKTKNEFIGVSSSKKNAAAKGVMGKIRDVVENMMYPNNAAFGVNDINYQLETDILLGNTWSLNQYRRDQIGNEEPLAELEKSIIANLADDVTVSIKGKNVEVVITKTF